MKQSIKYNLKLEITKSGQTLLSLLMIMIIGITVATGAAILIVINSQSGLKIQQGEIAYSIAQSGADNALLRLLRDPSYQGDNNFAVDGGFADIKVSSSGASYIATSSGKIGNFIRTVQIQAHYTSDYQLVIDSRKEIF